MSIRTRSDRARLLVAALVLALASTARADDDANRERFKAGMDRYKAGDYAGAITTWEALYHDVGAEKGYRVGFDLARVYEKEGDAGRAAERYEAFLDQVDARRARGEALEAIVASEEKEARSRLAAIAPTKGRLQIESAQTTSAQVDAQEARPTPFVVYVDPGAHVVTFAPATHDESKRDVTLAAGERVTVAAPLPAAPSPTPTPSPAPPPNPSPIPIPTPPPPPPALRHETQHPFSPALLYASSAVTLGAIVFTSIEYAHASALRNDFDAAAGDPARQSSIRDSYDGTRSRAYVGLGASLGLAAITGALVTWYAAGTTERDVPVVAIGPTAGGAIGSVGARF